MDFWIESQTVERQQLSLQVVGHVKWQSGVNGYWSTSCEHVDNFVPITTDLQISRGLQMSSRTVCREPHGMGFDGRSKSYSTKCSVKCKVKVYVCWGDWIRERKCGPECGNKLLHTFFWSWMSCIDFQAERWAFHLSWPMNNIRVGQGTAHGLVDLF